MKRLIILLALIIMVIPAAAQEKVSNDDFINDFDYLVKILEETHPDPYSGFGGKVEFKRTTRQSRQEINKINSHDEFIVFLNNYLSHLHDGHTYVSVNREVKSEGLLPVQFRVAADGLFIQNSTADFSQYVGQRVTRINGFSLDDLRKKVNTIVPAENKYGEYSNIVKVINSHDFSKKLLGDFEKITLTLDSENLSLSLQEKPDFLPHKSNINNLDANGLISHKMIGKNGDIGYLVWNSIIAREHLQSAYKNKTRDIEQDLKWVYAFFKKERTGDIEKDIAQVPSLYEEFYLLFKEMSEKKTNRLIIDLRRNGGGMTPLFYPVLYALYGDHYLNFDFQAEAVRVLSPLVIKKWGFESIEAYNKRYHASHKMGDYIFSSFGNASNFGPPLIAKLRFMRGYNGFGREFMQKIAALKKQKYEILVLTAPKTFSAAYHFAYFLKRLGRVKLVGVASSQAGNAYMEATRFKLPNTGLKGSISNFWQQLFPNESKFAKTLTPDYEMNYSNFKHYNFDYNATVLKALDIFQQK